MFTAFIVACYLSAGGAPEACGEYALHEQYRTLSDCLIRIEEVSRYLHGMRSELREGTCTREPSA